MILFDILPGWAFNLFFLVGLIGVLFNSILGAIPFVSNYKFAINVASVLLLVAGVMYQGFDYANDKWRAEYNAIKLKNYELRVESEKITVEEVVKYVDRIQIVKERGSDVIKEIPIYITKFADDNCNLTAGLVLNHNAATQVPGTTGSSDETTTKAIDDTVDPDEKITLKLSEYQSYVNKNYSLYHELAEQIISLQSWIKRQAELAK